MQLYLIDQDSLLTLKYIVREGVSNPRLKNLADNVFNIIEKDHKVTPVSEEKIREIVTKNDKYGGF
jgi:hypothetical protein